MNLRQIILSVLLTGALGAAAVAQAPQEQLIEPKSVPYPNDSARADAYYNFTMGHIYEQQYEATSSADYATKAIEAYKKAYALDPKSQVIGERLAEMYWKAQRIHDAVAEAQEILKRDPDNVQSRRLLGRIYLRSLGDVSSSNGQPETVNRAIEQYREINRLDPSDTESALWLARLYRLKNEHDKAEQVLRSILKTDPESEPTVEQLTQLLMDEGKSAEAVTLLESITAHSPSAVLLDLLGDAYTQTHELAKAEAAYRQAVDLDPSEPSHQRGLGQTLLAEEKYSEALKVYQKLSDVMPDDSDVYLRIAQIYRELHQLDKAEANLVKARQYAPGSLEVMYNEAMLYQAQGRYEDAIRVLSNAVTDIKGQSPTQPSRRRSLAILYQQLGQLYERGRRYKEAEDAAHAAEMLPGQPRENEMVWFLLGAIYERQKFFDKAEEQFKKVLSVNPKNAPVLNYYGYMLGDLGIRLDEAEALVQQALKEDPFNGAYLDSLGWIYFKESKFGPSESTLRKAVERERHDATIHSHPGDLYAKTGRGDLAAAEWEKSLVEWRRSLPADMETDKVAELEKKISRSKHRVAQKSTTSDAKP